MEYLVEVGLFSYFFLVLLYFIAVNVGYVSLLVLSFREIVWYLRHNSFSDPRIMVRSELVPPVSILAPAYNEEASIVQSVKSLLKLNYGTYEVIVINDGSRDRTLDTIVEAFGMKLSRQLYLPSIATQRVRGIYRSRDPEYRNLVVVDKENGGKADALNAGINASRYEYFCAIDADSLLEDNALLKVMKPFLEDETVVAAGGIVRIANGCEVVNGRVIQAGLSDRWLPIFQVVEYFRAFLAGRMAWHGLNALLIISGAFGLFRKSTVLDVGGYLVGSVGEDMELIVRIHRTKRERRERYRIVFVPDPVCWTEAPDSLAVLARQRNRWHRGLLETILLHQDMMTNARYGVVGLVALPYFFFVELLGPAIEMFGYLAVIVMLFLGILDLQMLVLFFIVALFYGVMFSVGAVILEEISFQRYPRPRDLALLLAFGVLENFGYRQLTMWWRVRAFFDYWRGERSWGQMKRTGFGTGAQTVR